MADQKTRPIGEDVAPFLAAIEEPRRADAASLVDLMSRQTGQSPALWGSIIGFGQYHYRYPTGTEGDTFLVGFAARRAEFSIHLMGIYFPDIEAKAEALLARLGKHRVGKACLYVRRLSDINTGVLAELIDLSVTRLKQEYGEIGRSG